MRVVKLENIAEVSAGQGAPQGDHSYVEDGIPFIKAGNLEDLIVTNDEYKSCKLVNKETAKKYKLKLYPKSTLVFAKSGMSATKGRIYLLQNESYVVNHLATIFPNIKLIETGYLKYFLYVFSPSRLIKDESYPSISLADINKIEIPLPPIKDQRLIVKTLDEADTLRQKRKQAIQLIDDYLKSVFLEMFGDPVKNPKNYNIQTINDVAVKEKNGIKAGPFGSSLKKEFYVKSGYKIYGQEQVIKDDFSYGDYYINEERYRTLESCKIQQGDILISLVGTFGKVSVVPEKFEPGIINPRLMKITPNQNIILPLFLKELLVSQSVQKQIEDVSHGGTMGIVNVGIIKKIKILVPSLDEQKAYLGLKEKSEKIKQSMLAQSAELEIQFQSLMQKAFKGEL